MQWPNQLIQNPQKSQGESVAEYKKKVFTKSCLSIKMQYNICIKGGLARKIWLNWCPPLNCCYPPLCLYCIVFYVMYVRPCKSVHVRNNIKVSRLCVLQNGLFCCAQFFFSSFAELYMYKARTAITIVKSSSSIHNKFQ